MLSMVVTPVILALGRLRQNCEFKSSWVHSEFETSNTLINQRDKMHLLTEECTEKPYNQ
jgi:hypothetical protein